ncbi:MAG: hypothetical protein QXZ59_06745 [Nitrososphaeria archaeon]
MTVLQFSILDILFDKVKQEAKQLNVNHKILMNAAVRAFIENPPEKIKPLPDARGGPGKKEVTKIYLTIPEDSAEKVYAYARSKELSMRKVVESAIANFLNLDDEQKKAYIEEEKRRLLESRKKTRDKNYSLQLLKAITTKEPGRMVEVSFKCVDELYKLIQIERLKRKISAGEFVRRAVAEFLQKYGDNYEQLEKLYYAAEPLFYNGTDGRAHALKIPAYILSQLTTISQQTLIPKSSLIRLALVKYLNLVDESNVDPLYIKQKTKKIKAVLNDPPDDPPDDPPQNKPTQNRKNKALRKTDIVNVSLPKPLYNLLRKYVILKLHKGHVILDDENQIRLEVSEITSKILLQWAQKRFSKKLDIETYVAWQMVLTDLKTGLYPSLKKGTVIKKQDVIDAIKQIKDDVDVTELFETFKKRGYLKELDNDNVKILIL